MGSNNVRMAVVTAPGRVEILARPQRALGHTDVRVRIKQFGICGSDVRLWQRRDIPPSAYPIPMGHEIAGIVTQIGSAVRNVNVGDAVAVWAAPFGFGGVLPAERIHGMAEEIVVTGRHCIRVPREVEYPFLLEPLGRVLNTIGQVGAAPGSHTVVIGASFKALLAVMATRALGRPGSIVVASNNPTARALAQRCGATIAVDPGRLIDVLGEVTKGRGAGIVYEFTGVPDALRYAVPSIGEQGALVVRWGTLGDRADDVRRLNVQIVETDRSDEDAILAGMAGAGQMLSGQLFDPAGLVTAAFPLEAAAAAFDMARHGVGRVIVKP